METQTKPRVLVVEDEVDLREVLVYQLRRDGFETAVSGNGDEALALAQSLRPDVVLLDLMIDGLSGWQVCQCLRRGPQRSAAGIIIISARSEEADILRCLEAGADDYVCKPLRPREIVARVRSVCRRERVAQAGGTAAEVLEVAALRIDRSRYEVTAGGRSLVLTATEYRLLNHLAFNAERVLSRDQLMAVAGDVAACTTAGRNIDVHVRALRVKLGEHASLIETVRGVGYRLRAA